MWWFIYEGARREEGNHELEAAERLTGTEWSVSEGSRLREVRQYDRGYLPLWGELVRVVGTLIDRFGMCQRFLSHRGPCAQRGICAVSEINFLAYLTEELKKEDLCWEYRFQPK